MQQDQFEKLIKAAEENAYLPIGINGDGAPVTGGFIPWEKTVSAFNMRTPKVTLAVSDLSDKAVLNALAKCRITGCYIFAPLDDYGFISGFKDLWDLFVLHGGNIRDLGFLDGLSELSMFYLEDASVPDLEPLARALGNGLSGPPKCAGFRNCTIGDASALKRTGIRFSELFFRNDKG